MEDNKYQTLLEDYETLQGNFQVLKMAYKKALQENADSSKNQDSLSKQYSTILQNYNSLKAEDEKIYTELQEVKILCTELTAQNERLCKDYEDAKRAYRKAHKESIKLSLEVCDLKEISPYDVNRDGKVNIKDLFALIKELFYLIGKKKK